MKKPHSFRRQLFAGFLLVSLIPLLICSAMLLQIFRLRLSDNEMTQAEQALDESLQALDLLDEGIASAVRELQENQAVSQALFEEHAEDTLINSQLFRASGEAKNFARLDLYDISGNWRYSTQTEPDSRRLPTNWGILYEAAQAPENALVYIAGEDSGSTQAPVLQGASMLTDRYGAPTGYLVISVSPSGFRSLLGGKAGAQNDLLLLSRYWRPVYCTRASLGETLAASLRAQLLAGEPLSGLSEDYIYSIRQHPATGLYVILQQPQLFTRSTMRLLYTVSISCALICVAVCVAMSFQMSRQLFRPIGQLHHAIRQVGKNNLDVHIPVGQQNELGELAQQFNTMVIDLKHNQQVLVENQQALNEAQIRMLQAQLNPHFLCNTLDTMKWISKINQVPQVALMSTNLADIMRFCITPEEFVPLRQEVEILKRYMEIQRIRLADSFTFSVSVPPELEDCLVPKMMLQPLAENAVLHGLTGVEGGRLEVTAQARDGILIIRVADNGSGLPPELLGKYRQRAAGEGHLGLFNVDTILQKHYGAGFGLYLENRTDGTGAIITATLPVIHKEETQHAEGSGR